MWPNLGNVPVLPTGITDDAIVLNDSIPSIEPLVNRVRRELGMAPTKPKVLCTCAVISTHESFKYQHEDFCPHFIKGVKQ